MIKIKASTKGALLGHKQIKQSVIMLPESDGIYGLDERSFWPKAGKERQSMLRVSIDAWGYLALAVLPTAPTRCLA